MKGQVTGLGQERWWGQVSCGYGSCQVPPQAVQPKCPVLGRSKPLLPRVSTQQATSCPGDGDQSLSSLTGGQSPPLSMQGRLLGHSLGQGPSAHPSPGCLDVLALGNNERLPSGSRQRTTLGVTCRTGDGMGSSCVFLYLEMGAEVAGVAPQAPSGHLT